MGLSLIIVWAVLLVLIYRTGERGGRALWLVALVTVNVAGLAGLLLALP